MGVRVAILGITGTGKSTVGYFLKNDYGYNVLEVDEPVIELNNGTWSGDDE